MSGKFNLHIYANQIRPNVEQKNPMLPHNSQTYSKLKQ